MPARLLYTRRLHHDDGGIVEMVIWELPAPLPTTAFAPDWVLKTLVVIVVGSPWFDVTVTRSMNPPVSISKTEKLTFETPFAKPVKSIVTVTACPAAKPLD